MTSVKKNIAYLILSQGANYLFPFITLPYLGRILGPGDFGLLVFCQGAMQYFVLLTDYGFNFTATRQVALHSGNRVELSRVFFETLSAKIFLAAVSIVSVLILTFTVPKFNNASYIIFACVPLVVGNALFPLWFFQGIERMKLVVMTSSIAKLILLLLTFLLVKTKQDIVIAALLQSSGNALAACIGLFVVWRWRLVQWQHPSIRGVLAALREGWPLFISAVAITFYTTLNVVLLGFTQGNLSAGYFGAAEKIRMALQGLITPFSQAFFPRLSTHKGITSEAIETFTKAKRVILVVSLTLGVGTYLAADRVVILYLGSAFAPTVPILKLMAILLPIIGLATIYGHLGLLARGHSRILSKIYVGASVLHLVYIYGFLHWFGVFGLVSAVILTETIVTIGMFVAFRKINRIDRQFA